MPKQTFFNLDEKKRTRILDVAVAEFADRGYKGASVSRMVAEAGIAKGSFYQYFEDKDDLYIYIISTMVADRKLNVFAREGKRMESLPLIDFLRLVFHTQLDEFSSRPQTMKISMDLLKLTGEPIFQRLMQSYQHLTPVFFLPYIQRDIDAGRIDPKINRQLLNSMIFSLGQYLIAIYTTQGTEVLSHAFLDDLVDDLAYMLEHGIYGKGGAK